MQALTAIRRALVIAAATVAVAGCTRPEPAASLPATMADGAYALPAGYRDWPVFLRGVQRPDAGQVRDIYLNRVAAGATAGQPFPDGSVLVMDLFAAQKSADGSLVKGPDGALVRGDLIKRFVMAKGPGWGAAVTPAALRTGDWVYSAWLPDGQPAPDPVAGCRGCHLPLAAQDYVPRASEYFASRR
jgi:hemoglobin